MATKIYQTNNPSRCTYHFRIGRALVQFEFKDGKYATETELFQRAIENSEAFRNGEVTLNKSIEA